MFTIAAVLALSAVLGGLGVVLLPSPLATAEDTAQVNRGR